MEQEEQRLQVLLAMDWVPWKYGKKMMLNFFYTIAYLSAFPFAPDDLLTTYFSTPSFAFHIM